MSAECILMPTQGHPHAATVQGIPVRALVRDGVKAAGMLPAAGQGGGVEIVEGDV